MVSFNSIPPNIRVPLFYAEVDNSQASARSYAERTVLLGHKLAAGVSAANVPQQVPSADQAAYLFGPGSMLHHMARIARQNDPFGEIWAVAVAEPAGGVAAAADIVIAGPASAAGTLPIYIGNRKYAVAVASGDTAAEVATALAAAIQADSYRHVTAAADDDTVTVTARHTGTIGNGVRVEVAPLGLLGGEAVPAGITVTVADLADGSGVVDLGDALAAIGDDPADYIALPWTDTGVLDAIKAFLADDAGRWGPLQQLYGGAFSARIDTLGNLSTFGNARNDQHVSVLGLRDCANPAWEVAAAYAARCGQALKIDPARPVQTLALNGVAIRTGMARFGLVERNTLLFDGMSTAFVGDDGTVRVERATTTYQTNAWGQGDASYLDVTTPYTLATVLRRLRYRITQKFPRHKLANDGTPFGAGQAIVTPKMIRAELIAEYKDMMRAGLVENLEAFQASLIVERNADDPNRIDVVYGPDLVNQLRIFAVLAQFRLQYADAA